MNTNSEVSGSGGSTYSIHEKGLKLNILNIEGEVELISPNNNFKIVQDYLQEAKYLLSTETGHFPMLEKPDDLLKLITDHL